MGCFKGLKIEHNWSKRETLYPRDMERKFYSRTINWGGCKHIRSTPKPYAMLKTCCSLLVFAESQGNHVAVCKDQLNAHITQYFKRIIAWNEHLLVFIKNLFLTKKFTIIIGCNCWKFFMCLFKSMKYAHMHFIELSKVKKRIINRRALYRKVYILKS